MQKGRKHNPLLRKQLDTQMQFTVTRSTGVTHSVCQLEPRSIFVPFSFITFSLCSVRLNHLTVAQSHLSFSAQ